MPQSDRAQSKVQEVERYGRYEVIRKLASGGMGEVFLAKSIGAAGFQKHVVIKKILPHLTEHPQTVKSLVREAKLLVLLNHPNVVQVFDLGVEGTDYFMAMEYVHGYNLSTTLHYCSKLKITIPAPACAYIAVEVLRALSYAHELRGSDGTRQNIIHRDVSPQNVMISSNGQVKLTDFGIAKVLSEAEDEHTQSLKGKWRYMAPEALDGGRIDQRYDLFAVGILLFESLCRRNLFSGKRDVDILNQAREAKVPDLHKYHPEAPDALVRVIEKSLSRDPEGRYQTARELAQALLEAISPVSESQAAEQLCSFVPALYSHEDFPLNKPKIVDPNAVDTDATRSLILKSRLSEVPLDDHLRPRRAGTAIVLLALGLAAVSSVVAYIAYTMLYRVEPKPGDNSVIIIDKRKDSQPAPEPDLTTVDPEPDGAITPPAKNHVVRLFPAAPFDAKIGAKRFGRQLRALERCFKKHAPGQSAIKFKVASTIRSSGKVSKVVLDPPALTSTPLGKCVAAVAKGVRYPRHTTDGVTFLQPITLKKTQTQD